MFKLGGGFLMFKLGGGFLMFKLGGGILLMFKLGGGFLILKKHHTVELHQKGTILHQTFFLTHHVYIQVFLFLMLYV